MTRLRVGAVSYLNTLPLVTGLREAPGVDLTFDVPSRCAANLHQGVIDIGLIPSIELLRGDYAVVPGIAIASEGPVASVALFTRVPVERIRTVALDTSSRTSAALVRVLCRERFAIAPRFEPWGPDLPAMLARCDAALLIGDKALFAEPGPLGATKIDLGAEWTSHTGLPFVWAVWAGRDEVLTSGVCQRFQASRDEGLARLDAIAADYAAGDTGRAATAAHYLRCNIQYDLGPRHVEALHRFFSAAAEAGVVEQARTVRFARGAPAAVLRR